MAKKSKHAKTQRERRTARRASIARKRRARRRAGAGERRSAEQYMITVAPGRTSNITEVRAADRELHAAYLEAHDLLPAGYPSSEDDMYRQLSEALCTLHDPRSSSDAILWAILILGHTPDARALTALRLHSSSGGVHAGMARVAADECAWWLETAESKSERPAQASPMMN